MGQCIELRIDLKKHIVGSNNPGKSLELFQSLSRSKVQLLRFLSAALILFFFSLWEISSIYIVCPVFALLLTQEKTIWLLLYTVFNDKKHLWTLTWLDKCVLAEAELGVCVRFLQVETHADAGAAKAQQKRCLSMESDQPGSRRLQPRLGRDFTSWPPAGLLSRLSTFGYTR